MWSSWHSCTRLTRGFVLPSALVELWLLASSTRSPTAMGERSVSRTLLYEVLRQSQARKAKANLLTAIDSRLNSIKSGRATVQSYFPHVWFAISLNFPPACWGVRAAGAMGTPRADRPVAAPTRNHCWRRSHDAAMSGSRRQATLARLTKRAVDVS